MPLEELAMLTLHPSDTLTRAVNLITSGKIRRFDWLAPYLWADVRVERDAAEQILFGASMNSTGELSSERWA